MENQKKGSEGEDSSGERGLLHAWKGYSCSVTPERVLLSRPVLQAALGTHHAVLLVEGGQVYSLGELPWKQDGAPGAAGRTVPNPTPVGVADLEAGPPQAVRVLELACGEQHTLALSARREVWAWGSGCQLGLVASGLFPVCQPQKVEHLAGRRTHVIISDNHYCPLGVELAEGEAGLGGGLGSPAQRLRPPLGAGRCLAPPSYRGRREARRSPAPGGNARPVRPQGAESPEPAGAPETDPDSAPQTGDCCRTPGGTGAGSKNSPYPDEQAVKDYLKRLSDHSAAEQTSRGPAAVQCAQPLSELADPPTPT
ncbi:hypothetical protein ANANG_G00273070 [Anguilla anguilla]|uniref:Uncharacterized protein n=1 Tax=Anguilla anguilla TaxID=7936 RepID=A0A9D3RJV3_ANGAN|nr:hypothetical protein ANANG_G00273070 [Anguilla anguilla]